MKRKKEVVVSVKDLHKSFKLPHEQHSGIKQAIINLFSKKRKKGYEIQKVLKGLDFEIEKGDFFGIVGRNGSGKSTLLKTLAGIYSPDKGAVQVDGSLVPFIELGVGFNPELTGKENVFLNGALLGFSHEDMQAMYDEIVEFAELEKFMDQKLKNYSSGMQVRLAFSIAIRADADILLLDEVLAVGDEAFQRKCFNYFAELKRKKKTVILVTHSMDNIQRFCNKAMLIDKGHELTIGNPSQISKLYESLNSENVQKTSSSTSKNRDVDVYLHSRETEDEIILSTDVTSRVDVDDAVVTFIITKNDGSMVYRWATDDKTKKSLKLVKGKTQNVTLHINNEFPDGVYGVQVGIKRQDRTHSYAIFDDISKFEIVNKGTFWNLQTKMVFKGDK